MREKMRIAQTNLQEAREMMKMGKVQYALLSVRQALEELVTGLYTVHDLEIWADLDGETNLVTLIEELRTSGVISEDYAKVFSNIRKTSNRAVHAGDRLPTTEEATEVIEQLEFILVELQERYGSADSDNPFSEKNAPMVNPNYYSPQRRYYGLWSNCYTRESLEVIPEYVKLRERADQGDIAAMLDIAVGFLPKKIIWSDMQLVCMPAYKYRGEEYFSDSAYDTRYYYWIIKACDHYCELVGQGVQPPQKYIATALLEAAKFKLCCPSLTSRSSAFVAEVCYKNNQVEEIKKDIFQLVKQMFEDDDSWFTMLPAAVSYCVGLTRLLDEYDDYLIISPVHRENTGLGICYLAYCCEWLSEKLFYPKWIEKDVFQDWRCNFYQIGDHEDETDELLSDAVMRRYVSDPVCRDLYSSAVHGYNLNKKYVDGKISSKLLLALGKAIGDDPYRAVSIIVVYLLFVVLLLWGVSEHLPFFLTYFIATIPFGWYAMRGFKTGGNLILLILKFGLSYASGWVLFFVITGKVIAGLIPCDE